MKPLSPDVQSARAYADIYTRLREVIADIGKFPLVHGRHYQDRLGSRRLLKLSPILIKVAGMMAEPKPYNPPAVEPISEDDEKTLKQWYQTWQYSNAPHTVSTTTSTTSTTSDSFTVDEITVNSTSTIAELYEGLKKKWLNR